MRAVVVACDFVLHLLFLESRERDLPKKRPGYLTPATMSPPYLLSKLGDFQIACATPKNQRRSKLRKIAAARMYGTLLRSAACPCDDHRRQ